MINFNTFQHLAKFFFSIISEISIKKLWILTIKVDKTGSMQVSRSNLEQAKKYHDQLVSEGSTMLPIEKTKISQKWLIHIG